MVFKNSEDHSLPFGSLLSSMSAHGAIMPQIEQQQLREIIQRLIGEDRQFTMKERRSTLRQAFFRPATLLGGQHEGEPRRVFVRDISEQGLGLIHDFKVGQNQIANIAIHRLWDDPIIFRIENRWCENWGDGWQISGWQIVMLESD